MTNNQLCNVFGVVGCTISFLCMVAIFFGSVASAIGVVLGMLLAFIGLMNYE